MAKAVVVYSYTGKSLDYARQLAETEDAALAVAEELKRPGKLKAYTLGCFAAMRQRLWPIEPLDIDLAEYDEIILVGPIWAGHPAPECNSIIKLLPKGRQVSVHMLSGSGESACAEKIKALLLAQGCKMVDFQNIKS